MSRRVWDTLDGWDVAVGWDPPTSAYFLDISRECEHDDDEDREGQDCELCLGSGTQFLYSNLDDKSPNVDRMGGIHDLKYMEQVLNRHLTDWPKEVLNDVYIDQDQDIANLIEHYGAVGNTKRKGEG